MSLVSIIVPVYNVEQYLEECVSSIRNQSYENLEIILVDDGSPDRCGEMCERYARDDNRIVVIHKKNGGLGDARNAGVRKASGEYLLFVDSDDYLHRELVEKTVCAAEKTRADIVIFDYATVEPGSSRSDRFSEDICENQAVSPKKEKRIIRCSCSAINKLYRREFWNASGLEFPTGKYYEDLGTIPKLLAISERVIYKKEVLYYYRMREGSIMHTSNFKKNFEDRTAMLDGILKFYKEQGLFELYQNELEYLVFVNGYFVPSREIILNKGNKIYLQKFRCYAYSRFATINSNKYVLELAGKEKILWVLLKRKMYGAMLLLSYGRRAKDCIAAKLGGK